MTLQMMYIISPDYLPRADFSLRLISKGVEGGGGGGGGGGLGHCQKILLCDHLGSHSRGSTEIPIHACVCVGASLSLFPLM